MALNPYDDAVEQLADEPATATPAANPYDDIVSEHRTEQDARLRTTVLQAGQQSPDQAAEARRLADRFGMAPSIVEKNFTAFKQRATVEDASRVGEEAPRLREWLAANPSNAAVAQDDHTPLSALERTLGIGRNIAGALSAGVAGFSAGAWGAIQAGAESVSALDELQAGVVGTGAKEVTTLAPQDEQAFRAWVTANKITDVDAPQSKYDYRGYWKDIASAGGDQRKTYEDGPHFPDTYKQHGHPTFSVESKYSTGANDGGRWDGETFIPPTPVSARVAEFARGSAAVAKYLADKARGEQHGAGFVERSIYGGVESVGQMAPGLALSLLTGGSAAPMLGVAGVTTGGQAYAQAREQGVGVEKSLAFGGFQGAVEVATEYIPATKLLGGLAAKTPFLKLLIGQIVPEIATEEVATVLQNLGEWAALPSNKEKTLGDYAREQPSAMVATAISTLVAVGATTSAAHATAHVLEKLGEAASESKTLQRSPEAVQDLVAQAVKGGPLEHVYAPVGPFATYWQGQGVDPAAMAAELTGDPASYQTAVATGQDLAIPTARYVAKVAGTDHHAFFVNELRAGPDEMNVREATAYEANLAGEAIATPEPEPAAPVRVAVLAQLEAAGVPRATAESYATLYESTFGTLAARAGLDPLALYERYGLTIARPDVQAAAVADAAVAAQPAAPAAPSAAMPAQAAEAPARGSEAHVQQLETELRDAKRTADIEPLTGLANRAAFERAQATAEADPETAFVTFDVNNFKALNDEVGHVAGDTALKDIAAVIKQAATEFGFGERVFRTGGDEFAVLAGVRVAEQIRNRVEALVGTRTTDGVSVSVSGTIGPDYNTADVQLKNRKEARKRSPKWAPTELVVDRTPATPQTGAASDATDSPETRQGLSDRPAEQPDAEAGGLVEAGRADDRADPGRLPTPGLPDVDEVFERHSLEANRARLTPEVHRELARILDEMESFPFVSKSWNWIEEGGPKTGNAAGGSADITGGAAGAPVYDDVLAWSPVNLQRGKQAGKPAKQARGTRAAVLTAIRGVMATTDVANNLQEGVLRVAEQRAAGDFSLLSKVSLPHRDATVAPEAFIEALSEGFDDAVDQGEGDASFDVTEFDQALKPRRVSQADQLLAYEASIGREPERGPGMASQLAATLADVRAKLATWRTQRIKALERIVSDAPDEAIEAARATLSKIDEHIADLSGRERWLAAQVDKADTLDTGEQQPRLPGDVGAVRETDVATPAMEAPFSLTSETAKAKVKQTTLFQVLQPTAAASTAPTFYSRLTRAVEESKQAKASGAQWKATIRNAKIGINKDEFALASVGDLEDGRSYTRQEVLEYLQANAVTVEDVTLEDDAGPDKDAVHVRATELYDAEVDAEVDRLEEQGTHYDYGRIAIHFDEDEQQYEASVDGDDLGEWYDTEDEAQAAADAAVEDRREAFEDKRRELLLEDARSAANWGEALAQAEREMDGTDQTRYSRYVLPGGDPGSYREVFLTVPPVDPTAGPPPTITVDQVFEPTGSNMIPYTVSVNGKPWLENDKPRKLYVGAAEADTVKVPHALEQWTAHHQSRRHLSTWEDGHEEYSNIENPIVRIRLNTRTTVDGQRVLFLEEVQPPHEDEQKKMPALFTKNWRELGFKWALRHAAEQGLDAVAWTTGEQQAARYSLEKQVDEIRYTKRADGTYNLTVWKDGRSLDQAERMGATLKELEALVGKEIVNRIEQSEGDRKESDVMARLRARGDAVGAVPVEFEAGAGGRGDTGHYVEVPLSEHTPESRSWSQWGIRYQDGTLMGTYGSQEDAAGEMVRQNADLKSEPQRSLAGENLKIGGEGLKRLYDVDFKNVVNGLPAVKRNGGKVATVDLRTGDVAPYDLTEVGGGRWRLVDRRTNLFIDAAPVFASGSAAEAWIAEHAAAVTVPAVALTPELRTAVLGGQALFQQPNAAAADTPERRGSIAFGDDRQFAINLFARADLSTFLHESGHFFLEVLQDLAPTSPPIAGDLTTLRAWLFPEGDTGQAIDVAQHEQFARGFEAYLMEGKAPSVELRSAFANFRAWLIGVYKSLRSLKVDLSPEVRGVFDRLIATDQAIADAEQAGSVQPMFTTAAAAGMSEQTFSRYAAKVQDASRLARETLERKLLAEVQRAQTAAWKAARATIEAAVAADVHQQPVYRALAAMQRGTNPDGSPLTEGAAPEPLKLSRAILVAEFGEARLKALPKPYLYTVTGGFHPALVAEMFGFSSADELLTAITAAPAMRGVIQQETDRRMLAEHGSLLLDGTLHAKAQAAVANDGREEVIREEMAALGALKRQTARASAAAVDEPERAYERRWLEAEAKLRIAIAEGRKQVEVDELRDQVRHLKQQTRGAAARIQAALPPATVLRAFARDRIAKTKIQAVKPALYWSASRRAAQTAIDSAARQDVDGAIAAKQQELMNLALYREAARVMEDVAARVARAQALGKGPARQQLGLAGAGYLDQADGILDRYEFATVAPKVLARRAAIRKWIAELEGEGLPVDDLPEVVLNDARRINYQEVTVEELVGITDGLAQIVHLARLKNKLLKAADAREFAVVRDGLVTSIREHTTARAMPLEFRPADEKYRKVADWFASHTKIATLVHALDGHVDGGALWEAIIRPLNAAADAEATRKREAGTAYTAILAEHYPGRELATLNTKTFIPAIQGSLSKEGRLAVALNWGNQTSRDRLLADPSRKWSGSQVQAILDTLDARDWRFVQATWHYLNTFWPEIAAKQQRVTGLAPEKVEAIPVLTKFGEQRGGYYPLAYDGRLSARAGQHAAATEAKLAVSASYVRSTTRRGHVEARQQNVTLPVRLELGVVFQHLEQVIHDLTHHEMLIDVTRLLRDGQVSAALTETKGDLVRDQFTRLLQDVAIGSTQPAISTLDKAATFMRTGTQLSAMGYNLWTGAQQPLGLFNGMSRVGPTWVMKGMIRWLRDSASMESTAGWIASVSPMMRERVTTGTQDLSDVRKVLQQPGGWFDALVRTVSLDTLTQQTILDSYLWHIGLMQRVADIPTWLGQYEKSMASGEHEARAIALADQAVLDSQGGGQIKDLAQVQRGSPVARLFLTFYSYGNTIFNATAREAGATNFKSPASVATFLGHLSLLYVMPAVGAVALSRLFGKSDGDDLEEFVKDVGRDALSAALNTMVLVRELGGLVQEGTRGYAGPAGARTIELFYNLGKQAKQGAIDEGLVKALNQAAGVLFRYPAGQVQRTVDGFVALQEGRTSNPAALLFGAPKKGAR